MTAAILRRSLLHAAVLAPLSLLGCAHAELHLELDVYRGDPAHEIPLTPEQLVALGQELDRGLTSVDAELQRQRSLAQDALAVYEEFSCLHVEMTNAACKPEDLKTLEDQLPPHIAALEQRAARTKALLQAAKASVAQYEKPGATTDTGGAKLALQAATLRARVTEAADSLRAFGQPPNTSFQRDLAAQWDAIGAAFVSNPTFADRANLDQFKPRVASLRQKVISLASRLQATVPDLAKKLVDAAAPTQPARELARSLAVIGQQVNSLPTSGASTSIASGGLAKILGNRELYDSQIDRLKDPADPIWRIVSAPENAAKWNQVFTKTWFYAQGKSDVIVVRDGPLDYRIQSASNNPTALVQSQLQISRAVSNAAISVLGSAAGVKLNQAGASAPGTTAEETDASAVEAMAGRTARVEEAQRLRGAANHTIQAQLRALADELSTNPPAGRRDQLLDRLQGLLKGYKEFLTSIAAEASNDSH